MCPSNDIFGRGGGQCPNNCPIGDFLSRLAVGVPIPKKNSTAVTENAFVWLKIEALSDLLFDVVRLTNVLTYLLSYLPSRPSVIIFFM